MLPLYPTRGPKGETLDPVFNGELRRRLGILPGFAPTHIQISNHAHAPRQKCVANVCSPPIFQGQNALFVYSSCVTSIKYQTISRNVLQKMRNMEHESALELSNIQNNFQREEVPLPFDPFSRAAC